METIIIATLPRMREQYASDFNLCDMYRQLTPTAVELVGDNLHVEYEYTEHRVTRIDYGDIDSKEMVCLR